MPDFKDLELVSCPRCGAEVWRANEEMGFLYLAPSPRLEVSAGEVVNADGQSLGWERLERLTFSSHSCFETEQGGEVHLFRFAGTA